MMLRLFQAFSFLGSDLILSGLKTKFSNYLSKATIIVHKVDAEWWSENFTQLPNWFNAAKKTHLLSSF